MFNFKCDPLKQFTCWNGDCLALEKRCNEINDCNDRSDEYHCQQIRFDKGVYRKTYVPKSEKAPLKIEVSFDVTGIVEINEAEVQSNYFFCFTMSHFLFLYNIHF